MYVKKPYIGNFGLGDGFGTRMHPITKINKMHNGQDIPMPTGTKIYAPMAGEIVTMENDTAGKFAILYCTTDKNTKVQFIFCHLSKFLVNDGAVTEWQEIALSGNTGGSTGPHLHLGVKIAGSFVDPLKYINFA